MICRVPPNTNNSYKEALNYRLQWHLLHSIIHNIIQWLIFFEQDDAFPTEGTRINTDFPYLSMHQQYDYTISTKQILAILQEVYYKYYDGIVLVWAVSKMNTTKAIFSNDKTV